MKTPTTPAIGSPPESGTPVRDEMCALLRLALPIVLIAFVNMGMSLTDTLMVSAYLGADALAAVAIGSDLQSIVFYCLTGILGGLGPFFTAAFARRQRAERVRLDRIGRVLVTLLALIGAPLIWFAPDGLRQFGFDVDLLDVPQRSEAQRSRRTP